MKDITLCHPRLQEMAKRHVEECKKQGYAIAIGETFRTAAEQDSLYAQGRTKAGAIITNAPGSSYSSMHQWGIAYDIYRNDGKGAYNEEGQFFQKVGAIGKTVGLEWGGDWRSIVDKPHFQLPDWGSTPSKLKTEFKTPDAFKKTWKPALPAVGWVQDVEGFWYRHADGSYTKNDWEQIDGRWYWFNEAGYAVSSAWVQTKGKWYYLKSDRTMAANEVLDVKGEVFAFGPTGAMETGTVTLKANDRGALIT